MIDLVREVKEKGTSELKEAIRRSYDLLL